MSVLLSNKFVGLIEFTLHQKYALRQLFSSFNYVLTFLFQLSPINWKKSSSQIKKDLKRFFNYFRPELDFEKKSVNSNKFESSKYFRNTFLSPLPLLSLIRCHSNITWHSRLCDTFFFHFRNTIFKAFWREKLCFTERLQRLLIVHFKANLAVIKNKMSYKGGHTCQRLPLRISNCKIFGLLQKSNCHK